MMGKIIFGTHSLDCALNVLSENDVISKKCGESCYWIMRFSFVFFFALFLLFTKYFNLIFLSSRLRIFHINLFMTRITSGALCLFMFVHISFFKIVPISLSLFYWTLSPMLIILYWSLWTLTTVNVHHFFLLSDQAILFLN